MQQDRLSRADVLERTAGGSAGAGLIVFALDLLTIGLVAAVVVLMILGPGIYEPFGVRLKLRTANNPVTIALAAVLLRIALGPSVPVLRSPRVSSWLGAAVARVSSVASAGPRAGSAARIVLWCAAITLAARLFQAWWHPGFATGDDVEIHEMTLGALWNTGWPVWDLRSAFYPMTFVYPWQALAQTAGAVDVPALVLAGRVPLAVLSTITVWLAWLAGRKLAGPEAGLVAAVLVAIAKLQVGYGSTELPRPLAATLLTAAFLVLLSPGARRAAAGGVLIGVAAALRFSEAVFLLPAAVHVWTFGRRRDTLPLVAGAAFTAIAITALADAAYWGEPLRSVRHAWTFTLADRLSSRGFQPFHYYISALQHWTNWIVAGFACLAWKNPAARPALIWTILPIVVLSALPHKENRYLIPVVPFLSIAAAAGIIDAGRRARGSGSARYRAAFAALLAAAALYELGEWRLRRSDDAVALARYVRGADPQGGVGVDQLWRAGGRLYLSGRRTLVDLAPESIEAVARSGEVSWLLLHVDTVNRQQLEPTLTAAGWRREVAEGEYLLFAR
jgi:hypothetical protein